MKLERMSLSKEQAHILLRACATAMDRDKIYRVRAFMTQDGTALTPQDEQLIDEAIMETYVRTGDSESAMQLFNSYIEAKKPISSSLYVLAMTACNRVSIALAYLGACSAQLFDLCLYKMAFIKLRP